jgi:hypothetical protein
MSISLVLISESWLETVNHLSCETNKSVVTTCDGCYSCVPCTIYQTHATRGKMLKLRLDLYICGTEKRQPVIGYA